MGIDRKTVQHIALLSRLALSEAELELYSKQLADILSYISKLNEVDTKDTPPTSHVLKSMVNIDRADELKASLPVEAALANAPERDGDFFKIPKVIEGK